jgi:hypothetical protein
MARYICGAHVQLPRRLVFFNQHLPCLPFQLCNCRMTQLMACGGGRSHIERVTLPGTPQQRAGTPAVVKTARGDLTATLDMEHEAYQLLQRHGPWPDGLVQEVVTLCWRRQRL